MLCCCMRCSSISLKYIKGFLFTHTTVKTSRQWLMDAKELEGVIHAFYKETFIYKNDFAVTGDGSKHTHTHIHTHINTQIPMLACTHIQSHIKTSHTYPHKHTCLHVHTHNQTYRHHTLKHTCTYTFHRTQLGCLGCCVCKKQLGEE